MGEIAVDVEHVSKSFKLFHERSRSMKERFVRFGRGDYEEFHALDDVDFSVGFGETVGLLGHNGSGKSTLLKCIAGTLRPTSGSIATRGRVAALLELGSGFHPDLTGRENIYLNGSILGMKRTAIDRIFDDIVGFAELEAFIDSPVRNYSSGMYTRLGFAVAINVDPDILLIDEVLSVGDENFQRKCLDRVKKFQQDGRTILFVTHDAEQVRLICDRAVVLDHGVMIADAPPPEGIRSYREALLQRGLDAAELMLAEEAAEAEEGDVAEVGRAVTGQVVFTDVTITHGAGDNDYLLPGEPLRISVGYRARERVEDIVFAIEIHDQAGNRLLGANSDRVGSAVDAVEGEGVFEFVLTDVPLLDGSYFVSLGMHTHDAGIEYDHRDQLDHFSVLNPDLIQGLVRFGIETTLMPGVG